MIKNMYLTPEEIKKLIDLEVDSIVISKPLIRKIGLSSAIIYHVLLDRYVQLYNMNNSIVEFTCTQEEIEDSTGISQTAQRTAIKKLKEVGLLNYCEMKGMPRKTYYNICTDTNFVTEFFK